MKYIDKSKNLPQGDEIIDQLLSESWNAEESRYIGADYDGLRAPLYKVPLTDLLLDEQRMTCCYCMKVLQSTDVTIEHIIPQGITMDDMENYLVVRELTDHLIHKDRFDRTVEQQHPDKYPHDIAYSNLLASCYSQEHCNHFRGSKEIKPFFFDPDIELKVKYDVAGLIDCE